MSKRIFAMLLCLVMVAAMLPVQALATDGADNSLLGQIAAKMEDVALVDNTENAMEANFAQAEDAGVQVAEDGEMSGVYSDPAKNWKQDEYGGIWFSSFAELKELLAKPAGEAVSYYYEGKEDLVITEDITLPRDCLIFMMEEENDYHPKLVIAKGVTMVNEGNLSLDGLDVKGTLVNNWWLVARETLTVTGKIQNNQEIVVTPQCQYSGIENIIPGDEWNRVMVEYVCHSGEELVAAASKAAKLPENWRANMCVYTQDSDITLNEHITVPAYSDLQVFCDSEEKHNFIIGKGGKVTIQAKDARFYVDAPVVVEGTVENNCYIQMDANSKMSFTTGTYTGSGRFMMYVDTSAVHYSDMLTGLNFDEFFVEDGGDYWTLRSKAGLTKLAAPTDLMWGKVYEWNDDWTEMVLKDQPGSMAWGVSEPSQNQYYVCLYKEDGTLVNDGWYYAEVQEGNKWCSSNMFVADPPESGNYYFTVQAIAGDDSDEYVNSDIVKSGIYTYVRPTKKLSKPTNVKLVEPKGQEVGYAYLVASFQAKKGDYSVEWYVSKSKDTEPSLEVSYTYTAYQDGEQRDYVGKSFMNDYSGYYFYVRVRAISDNIEKAIGSDWTALSAPVKYVKKVVKKLSAPTGLKTYKDPYTGKPIIIWNPVKDAETYDLYRSTKKTSGYKKINAEPIMSAGYYDETAKAGTTYYYKVKAVNGSVKSGYSSYKSGACATAAPMISSANTASSGKVKLSWAKVENAEKYYIYRSTKKTSGFEKIGSTTKAYYTDSDAKVGTTYYYKVKAVVDGITSEYSNIISDKRVCAQPDLSVKRNTSTGQPSLSWDKVSGAKEYKIYRAEGSVDGKYTLIKTATSKTTSYADTKALPGVTYFYRVDVIGSKSGTNSVAEEPISCLATCAKPSISVKNDAATGDPVITWKAVKYAVSYRVQRSTKSSSGFQDLDIAFETSFQDTTASTGKKYYYRVIAVTEGGESGSASSAKSVYSKVGAPVIEVALSGKKPKVTWEKVEGATKYEVYRATSKSGKYTKVKTTTGASFTDSKASKGKTYYYKVKAVAPSSSYNSAYSNIFKIKSK